MLDFETLRFNWICNHSHLSRNQKKSQRFNTEVKEILNTWEYQEISQVGTPDDCELGHFCDQKEISLLKKTSIRWFFKLCFWWLSRELFWERVSLKCLFEKKKIISIDKGLQRLMVQLLKLMKQMFSHFLSWPNRIGSIALEFGVDLEDNQQCFDYSAVLPRNNGNRNKYLYVLIPLNGPCSVFNSSLSFHSCDIWCPHLFLVFPKHFILSVLAKHHDSDQFGCSLKTQLTPDGEPQLLCETDKKTPNLKTYEPLKYCWQFYQRCFPDNRCSYLYFFLICVKQHII